MISLGAAGGGETRTIAMCLRLKGQKPTLYLLAPCDAMQVARTLDALVLDLAERDQELASLLADEPMERT